MLFFFFFSLLYSSSFLYSTLVYTTLLSSSSLFHSIDLTQTHSILLSSSLSIFSAILSLFLISYHVPSFTVCITSLLLYHHVFYSSLVIFSFPLPSSPLHFPLLFSLLSLILSFPLQSSRLLSSRLLFSFSNSFITCIIGALAQDPRHSTSLSVNMPSAVVSPSYQCVSTCKQTDVRYIIFNAKAT